MNKYIFLICVSKDWKYKYVLEYTYGWIHSGSAKAFLHLDEMFSQKCLCPPGPNFEEN